MLNASLTELNSVPVAVSTLEGKEVSGNHRDECIPQRYGRLGGSLGIKKPGFRSNHNHMMPGCLGEVIWLLLDALRQL